MPSVYVYNGGTTTVNGAVVRDGQMIIEKGWDDYKKQHDLEHWYNGNVYGGKYPEYNNIMSSPMNRDASYNFGDAGGTITHISEFNKKFYGSVNAHAASGGCMYTMRESAQLKDGNGNNLGTLYAGDAVIIGGSYPHGEIKSMTGKYIRFWGYRRGGRGGAETETNGLWFECDMLDDPSGYTVNTL